MRALDSRGRYRQSGSAMAEIAPEAIAEIELPSSVRISPNADCVVYTLKCFTRKNEHTVSSIWMADIGKEKSARQLTRGKSRDSGPQFSPDGGHISFLSDRDTQGKLSTIYHLPLEGPGEAMPLTPIKNKKEISGHAWSPNGLHIAYTSPDEKDLGKDDAKVYGEHWEHARLRILDVKTNEIYTVVNSEAHVANFSWSPDSQSLAYTIAKSPELDHVRRGGELYIAKLSDKSTSRLCRFHSAFVDLTWFRDDLFWVGKVNENRQTSTGLWHIATQAQDSDPEQVAYGEYDCALALRCCGDHLAVYVQNGLADHLELYDSGKLLFAEKMDISAGWDVGYQNNRPIISIIKSRIPSCQEVFSVIDNDKIKLSQHCKLPSTLLSSRSIRVELKADDGTPVDGMVYLPIHLDPQTNPPPGVVVVHGGPYFRVSEGLDPMWGWTPWLLSLGYVVLAPNYRGGSGHGKLFAEAVKGDASESYQDVITFVKKCVADDLIDRDRISICGWSQGGYITYLAVTKDSIFHFAAAIAGAGVSCWDTMAMTSDIPEFQAVLGGGVPWLSSSADFTARHCSPIWFMENIKTPLLILHGEEDARVPVSQALAFHRGMLARGRDCEMALYPREGHGVPKHFETIHFIHLLKKMKSFLEKHIERK